MFNNQVGHRVPMGHRLGSDMILPKRLDVSIRNIPLCPIPSWRAKVDKNFKVVCYQSVYDFAEKVAVWEVFFAKYRLQFRMR